MEDVLGIENEDFQMEMEEDAAVAQVEDVVEAELDWFVLSDVMGLNSLIFIFQLPRMVCYWGLFVCAGDI